MSTQSSVQRAAMLLALAGALAGCSPQPTEVAIEPPAGATIVARSVSAEPPLAGADAAWSKAPATEIAIYPQTGVPPAEAADARPATVSVRALFGGGVLALRLEWADTAPAAQHDVGRFADAAAVQWPAGSGEPLDLPYVGMGHHGAPVALWFWRADGTVQTLAAEGLGTLSEQAPDGVQAEGAWQDGIWRVVFRRRLAAGTGEHAVELDPAQRPLAPLALAVWNGADAQRNGLKRLSSWQVLYFEGGAADAAYPARQLGTPPAAADPESGRRLMSEKGCIACHVYPDNPARPHIGPDLTYAGGIHSVRYLIDSLLEPSRVVVPGKGYFSVQDGKRVSLMPPFAGTAQERDDIVAYLLDRR